MKDKEYIYTVQVVMKNHRQVEIHSSRSLNYDEIAERAEENVEAAYGKADEIEIGEIETSVKVPHNYDAEDAMLDAFGVDSLDELFGDGVAKK